MNSKMMKKKPGPGAAKKPGPPIQLLQKQAASTGAKKNAPPVDDSGSDCSDDYDPEYEHPDDAEDFEDYKPDGYHPVYLGEKFKEGRYVIVQKLGWGHFSTVWLAEDKETNTHVALKIQKSKKSYQEAAVDEIQLLGDLRKNENSTKWLEFIEETKTAHPECGEFASSAETFCVKLLDNFIHFGTHGKHYCSTFEIMGPNLLDLIQHFDDFDRTMKFWLVKLIARQCLAGLVYVHDVCGMIHTDIKPENVMIQLNADYFDQFLEQLKKITKKPFSMFFMKKQQLNASKSSASTNAKKDKKKEKKKAKKKAQEAGSQTTETTAEITQTVQETVVVTPSKTEEVAEAPTAESIIAPSAQEADEQKQVEEKKKEEEVEEQKQESTTEEANKSENKEGEEKKKKQRKGSGSSSSSESTIRDSDLYTLLWKKQIPIVLDNLLKVKLVDFGNACWNHKQFTDNIQTREYRSPEVILGIPYTYNTDVFSLACMIYELCTNEYLFKPRKDSENSKNDEHLALFQESLGKFKKDFALSGTRSRDYFNKNGQLIRIKDIEEYPITQILVREYDWSPQEASDLEDFLLPMLNYNPAKRISAREALKHPWLWN